MTLDAFGFLCIIFGAFAPAMRKTGNDQRSEIADVPDKDDARG